MSGRRRTRYRAVSPSGALFPPRRSPEAAWRDAVYECTGWGSFDADGFKLEVKCSAIRQFVWKAAEHGWTVKRIR